MKKYTNGFSIVEVIVASLILGIFLFGAYKAINNFYNVINYIDSNLNGLNLAKTATDEVINIRDKFLNTFPTAGWEQFVSTYGTGTFKLSHTSLDCGFELMCLVKIEDKNDFYEGPLDNVGNLISNTSGVYFYRKVDIQEENEFYLQNLQRQKTSSGEFLSLIFSKPLYNQKNMVLYGNFENPNISITSDISGIDFMDINGNNHSGDFTNMGNSRMRYSLVVDFDGVSIDEGESFTLDKNGSGYTFEFYQDSYNGSNIPIKIENQPEKTFYNLCTELENVSDIKCEYNFLLKENLYNKLVGVNRGLSGIDFGDDYTFILTGAQNNILNIYMSGITLPLYNTNLYLNPTYKMGHQTNTNDNNIIGIVSDATAGKGLLIPDLSSTGGVTSSTGYTSLLNFKVTTFLYDGNKYIDSYEIESKIGDINRY